MASFGKIHLLILKFHTFDVPRVASFLSVCTSLYATSQSSYGDSIARYVNDASERFANCKMVDIGGKLILYSSVEIPEKTELRYPYIKGNKASTLPWRKLKEVSDQGYISEERDLWNSTSNAGVPANYLSDLS